VSHYAGSRPQWTLRQRQIGSVLCVLVALLAQKTLDGQGSNLWPLGVLCFAGLSFALLTSTVDPEPPRPEPEPALSPVSMRFLAALLGISLLGCLDMGDNLFRPLGVALWVVGLALALLYLWLVSTPAAAENGVARGAHGRVWIPARWVALGAVLVLGAWLRLWLCGDIPADMGFDLASKFSDALSITRGQYNIFFPMRLGREGLFFYSTALVGRLAGLSRSTLHLTSGLIGVVTIVSVYQLARELFGTRPALLAAFLLAVNRWHIILSRSGFRACTMPLFTAWSLYGVLRALRTRRPLDWGLAGVAVGAGAYSYRSFLFVPIALAAGLALSLLPRWREGKRGLVGGLLIAMLVALAIAAPLLRYIAENPDLYMARQSYQLQAQEKTEAKQQGWALYLVRCLLVFNDQGDADSRFNYPYARQMGLVSAALLVLGAGCALRRPLSRSTTFLLSALLVLTLPAVLSMLPGEQPSSLRLSGVLVPAVVLAALPLDVLWRLLLRRPSGVEAGDETAPGEMDRLGLSLTLQTGSRERTMALRVDRRALLVCGLLLGALLLLGKETAEAYRFYFHDYPTRLPDYANYSVTRTMAGVMESFPDPAGTFVLLYPNWFDGGVLAMHLGVPLSSVPLLPAVSPDQPPIAGLQGAALFLLNPRDEYGLTTLRTAFPGGVLVEHLYPNGMVSFLAFYAER